MRKLLLLSAAALLAGAANAQVSAPTLTQDWSYTTDLPSGTAPRWAVGTKGKLYVPNYSNANLVCFDENGQSTVETGTKGWCVTADEAGNLIIQNALWSTGSTVWAILPAGKTEASDLITLTVTPPEGCAAGSMHTVGRAIGDVMSATGGAFYTLANGNTKISKIFVAEGAQVADKSVAIEIGGEKTYTGNSQGIVQPTNNDVEATDNVVWTIRSNANQMYKLDGTAYKEYAQNEEGASCGTGGGDIITLNGITFTIEPSGTHYSDGFVIVDRTNDFVVYTRETTAVNPQGNSITQAYVGFEKVSETKAIVYHYTLGVVAAKYTFEIPENYNDYVTAIETVEVDANAPVEYYNLQGVKVANPESGLFIKKQGSKTTKVVL